MKEELLKNGHVYFKKYAKHELNFFNLKEELEIGRDAYNVYFDAQDHTTSYGEQYFTITVLAIKKYNPEEEEYFFLTSIDKETFDKIAGAIEAEWPDIMPDDFYVEAESCPVGDDTKLY
jgi:hypothetical protein